MRSSRLAELRLLAWKIATRFGGGCYSRAEEYAQDALVHALRAFEQSPEGSDRFFAKVMRNRMIDVQRREKKYAVGLEAVAHDCLGEMNEDAIAARVQLEEMARSLPSHYVDVCRALLDCDMDYPAAAASLGITVSALKCRLYRIRIAVNKEPMSGTPLAPSEAKRVPGETWRQILALREQRMTVVAIAKSLGVSQGHVSKTLIRCGFRSQNHPPRRRLQEVA